MRRTFATTVLVIIGRLWDLKSVMLAKILYTSPAWYVFANSSDKDRLEAFLRRCTRLQLYRKCDPTVNQLVEDMEDKLFTSVINNDKHVLSHILPDLNNHTYNLRPRRHELTLAIKGDARNFFWKTAIQRHILITTISYFFSIHCIVFFVFTVLLRSDSRFYTLNWIELNWPRLRIEVRQTELLRYRAHTRWTLTFYLNLWPWLSIPVELWSWPTHTQTKLKFRGQSMSDRMEINRFTDSRTLPIVLTSRLMRLVMTKK